MSALRYIAMDQSGGSGAAKGAPAAVKVDVWDTVLEFGQYQHVTVDGKDVYQIFDASRAQAMLDDWKAHPESDVFYDKKHEVVDEVPALEDEPLSAYRARLQEWASGPGGDGHALAWGTALCSVVGSRIVRYEPHPGAPPAPPSYEKICQDQGRRVPDGVYVLRSRITALGAAPDGLDAFGYTSPFFVSQKDGDRLLNLTCTNDPRMRGAALARFEREAQAPVRFVTMTRTASGPHQEKSMPFDKEMMARCGMEESDSEAAKVEKFAKYIRKLEDESASAKKDKEEAMGRASKMEEDLKGAAAARQKMEDELGEMRRKFEEGKGSGDDKGKDKEEKEAMQAMQRRILSGLGLPEEPTAAKAKLQAMERAADQVADLHGRLESIEKTSKEDRRVAMQRAGDLWADDALSSGRWDPTHAGGDETEQEPAKRIAMTRTFLRDHYVACEGDARKADRLLLKAGTFQPDERVAMTRMTEGGAGKGAPDPREGGADPDAQMDAEISRIQKEAQAAGKPMGHAIAMERVKKTKPALYERYMNQLVGR